MYPNVSAERAKNKITLEMIANDPRMSCSVTTLSMKLNGKAPISFKEAIIIKEIIKSDLPLEVLFEEAE